MAEFKIGEHTYRSKKLNPFVQANIARRLIAVVPALGPLGPLMRGLALAEQALSDEDLDLSSMNPLFKAVGQLSDDDTNYIMKMCLSVTERQVGPAWVGLYNLQADMPQYNDMDFAGTMQIVWTVIADNMGSFTSALASAS